MSRFKILYVDDEVDNLIVFKSAFSKEFDVTTVTSALAALDVVNVENFDLIVADQRMPKLTGVEFFERVNANSLSAPKILLTGFSDLQAIIDSINKGHIYYYCTKPWKKDELKTILLKGIEYGQLLAKNEALVKSLSRKIEEWEVFLYKASHDLKTPITSLLGLLNLLKTEIAAEATLYLPKIEESISKLESTIKKLQILSSLSQDFLKHTEQIDIREVVDQVIAQQKETSDAALSQIDVRVESFGFYSSRLALVIILESLVDNALKYTSPNADPKVSIHSTISPSGALVLTVADNGPGIDTDQLEKAFEPFYRGSVLSSGIGLGLFIVKQVSNLLNASIRIQSGAEGTGTEVTLEIPAGERTSEFAIESPPPSNT